MQYVRTYFKSFVKCIYNLNKKSQNYLRIIRDKRKVAY